MEPTYTPPGSRSTAAILALYVKVGTCLLAVGADVRRIVVAGDLGRGDALVDELLEADQLVTVASLVELVALVVAAVLVLRWQVTAHRNLPALGDPAPRVGVRAGVASWFVPGLNLWAPYVVVGELWRAGERARPLPALLRVWWVAWVVALLAVLAAWLLLGDAEDVADRQRIDALRAGASALSAVAAGLVIAVVASTTSRQGARAAQVGAPTAPPPPQEPEPEASQGGLRVVSEERARRGDGPS